MLQFVLFQMDEAKRYLMEGSLPSLRIALILVDNAAELILDDWIAIEIARDDYIKRMQEGRLDDLLLAITEFGQNANEDNGTLETLSPPEHGDDFRDTSLPEHEDPQSISVLSRRKRRAVAHKFPCKVWYVTNVKHALPPLTGAVLKHLHRYRNAAHHYARINPETIKITVMIYFEICCQLLTSLRPRVFSTADFSPWMKTRFGLNSPLDLANDQVFARIVDDLRRGLPIGDLSMCETLGEHLENRIEEVLDGLDYIASNLGLDRVTALKTAQQFALQSLREELPYEHIPEDLDQPVSLEQLEELRQTARRIRQAGDYATAFETYASADIVLERIEYMVDQLIYEVDSWIDLQLEGPRIIVRVKGTQGAKESGHE